MIRKLLKVTIPKKYKNKLAWSEYLQSNISVVCYFSKNNWYFLDEATGLIKKAGIFIDFFYWE